MTRNVHESFVPSWTPYFDFGGRLLPDVNLAVDCGICDAELAITKEADKDLEAFTMLPCGHIFGFECLSEWFRHRPTCPSCRKVWKHTACGHAIKLEKMRGGTDFNIRGLPAMMNVRELPYFCEGCSGLQFPAALNRPLPSLQPSLQRRGPSHDLYNEARQAQYAEGPGYVPAPPPPSVQLENPQAETLDDPFPFARRWAEARGPLEQEALIRERIQQLYALDRASTFLDSPAENRPSRSARIAGVLAQSLRHAGMSVAIDQPSFPQRNEQAPSINFQNTFPQHSEQAPAVNFQNPIPQRSEQAPVINFQNPFQQSSGHARAERYGSPQHTYDHTCPHPDCIEYRQLRDAGNLPSPRGQLRTKIPAVVNQTPQFQAPPPPPPRGPFHGGARERWAQESQAHREQRNYPRNPHRG
ncbi:hypothetical protein GGR55DRAFT_673029 [Xylaria sp. FL0064]|nr:hypothetical protein GGR55DRAFT_673029 [Xylaria sp. FL0064]